MFTRRLKASSPPTEATNSVPEKNSSPSSVQASDQKTSGPFSDDGDVREALGYDRNDPNVTVQRLTLRPDQSLNDVFQELFGQKPADDGGPEPQRLTAISEPGEELFLLRLAKVFSEVENELRQAVAQHAPMHSPHEGYAVIREELDELWDAIKCDEGRHGTAREELIQVATMAIRYLLDIDPHDD